MTRAVVTDVEGTTTSLSMVKDVLFSYSRARLAGFVRAHAAEAEVKAIFAAVRREVGRPEWGDEAVVATLLRWIDEDRKATPLKALQGLVWSEGYARGDLVGHVYDDAVACLREWRARGIALYVYSSGSVLAQKLLFGHTAHGDLTGLFSGHFDTTTGGKLERHSYEAIAAAIGAPPSDVLFLSDSPGELDAAAAAGLATVWVDRSGADLSPAQPKHRRVASFDAISI